MAAMAPALTDAPAEARHIRLKLAASSNLSPASTENNSGGASILLPSSVSASAADIKLRPPTSPASRPLRLSKLQPLVASFLCSDVAPMAKEVKGILMKQPVPKGCGPLNGSLLHATRGEARGRAGELLVHTALSGGQLKGLVNGAGMGAGAGSSAMVPVNGLARKAAVPSTALPEKGSVATVNGDSSKPPASGEALLPLSSKSGDASSPRGDAWRLRELVDHNRDPENIGLTKSPGVKAEIECASSSARMMGSDSNPPSVPQSLASCSTPSADPRCPSSSSPSLEALLRERAQRSHRRQADLSGSLRRLCKRLRVVQAKQVERHIRQQLSGFVDHALAHSSVPGRGSRGLADLQVVPLGHFLKEGYVSTELEKLHLSGVACLRAAEAQFDSDATESSSGGESDLEEEELARVDTKQHHVRLWRRAEGRFALERASIISRWTWLQAHISDLEYRIRQQADIYRHIRISKGPVELEDPAPSALPVAEKAEPLTPLIFQSGTKAQIESAMKDFIPSSAAELPDAKTSVALDGGCSAARVRALIRCRRRRLVQPSMLQNLDGKVQCEVNISCMMCGSNLILPKAELLFEHPLLEKAYLQDPSIHPTLSLPSDMPLGVHLQRALKSHGQTRPLEKLKPLKKLLLKPKFPLPFSPSSSSTLSKQKLRLSSSHMAAVRLARHKARSDRSRRQHAEACPRVPKLNAHSMLMPCGTERPLDRTSSRKRAREALLDEPDSPKLLTEAGNPCGFQPSVQPSTPSSLIRTLSLPGDSTTPMAAGNQASPCSMPVRKKRNENSFDINNIVIPMSVAATTRVEKLQYKEIITPSWREVDVFARPLTHDDEYIKVEDLSDAAFAQLHQRCEEQERLRWRWTALAPAKRRGSRSYKSVDGRTTPSLGGTNPPSPDMGLAHTLQDYGPILSPLSPPSPDTPCSRDAHMPSSRDSQAPPPRDMPQPAGSDDTRCSSPDGTYEEMVLPWERRSFPLSEDPTLESNTELIHRHMFPSGLQSSHCGMGSEREASSP
ncbi:KAT8 regulatory NSL complex subunit 1 isoform X1 [Electrophorus electricus]|uniref:KAT8 regulatory NSL complex subunit 1 isoform X1 n=1 Tax=Electrophorus electricus TaxID=8005 RepID=UPI0015D0C142|nr:KAT8 regulatory NSL complex subunit 1 isoform X1 [Electrophorus electricus]